MLEMDCEVTVSGRNRNTVDGIAKDFSVTGVTWTDTKGFDIIINCTPIGMEAGGKYPAEITLENGQTIFDAVYNRITPLVDMAHKKGCTILDGKDMLIGQGAESFRLWFGIDADTESMRRALR
jgi:shikimate 5-dehydrogenase